MTEISSYAQAALERIHKSLDVGENVMLFGLGCKRESARKRLNIIFLVPTLFVLVLCFFAFTPVLKLFGWVGALFTLLGLYSLPLICIVMVVIGIVVAVQMLAPERKCWYALTSKRLVRMRSDWSVETFIDRSAVTRIEGSSKMVALTLTGPDGSTAEIVIDQVKGLPEVVGGIPLKIGMSEES